MRFRLALLGRLVSLLAIVTMAAACSAGSASPSAKGATTFEEFHTGFCSGWTSLFKAYGNPDTAAESDLTRAMNAAIAAGNSAEVDRLATEITSELEAGRRHVAYAGAWTPAAPLMAKVDGVFVAFEAMVEAKRAAAGKGLAEAQRLGQEAFEGAGGVEAWRSLYDGTVLEAIQSARPAGATDACPGVPIGL